MRIVAGPLIARDVLGDRVLAPHIQHIPRILFLLDGNQPGCGEPTSPYVGVNGSSQGYYYYTSQKVSMYGCITTAISLAGTNSESQIQWIPWRHLYYIPKLDALAPVNN